MQTDKSQLCNKIPETVYLFDSISCRLRFHSGGQISWCFQETFHLLWSFRGHHLLILPKIRCKGLQFIHKDIEFFMCTSKSFSLSSWYRMLQEAVSWATARFFVNSWALITDQGSFCSYLYVFNLKNLTLPGNTKDSGCRSVVQKRGNTNKGMIKLRKHKMTEFKVFFISTDICACAHAVSVFGLQCSLSVV